MAELFSDEWFAAVLECAGSLPPAPGVSFVFDAEIAEAPGKVRAHGRVVDGQLTEFASGKFKGVDGETAQVSLGTKGKYLAPMLNGSTSPLVAYMRGELKVDGEYERVVDHLANQSDRAALESFRSAVAAATD